MRGDGDGWVRCEQGHKHWGRHGAAGVLLRHTAPDGIRHIALQHRAAWSHHGDTWGIPGGARDSGESAVTAALREAAEEVGLDPALVDVRTVVSDDHGGWSYETVVAECDTLLSLSPTAWETTGVRWVAEPDVSTMPLHPGFAASWPVLRMS